MTAVVSVGIVFALTLLLDGFTASLHNEVARTVASFRASTWVVPTGSAGPFPATTLMPESVAESVARVSGVHDAAPMLAMIGGLRHGALSNQVNVLGVPAHGYGAAPVVDGRAPAQQGEIAVDRSLGVATGAHVTMAGTTFVVVGHTKGISYYAGTPAVFLTLHDAQRTLLGGLAMVSGVAVSGVPRALPRGLETFSNAQARHALGEPVHVANTAISFIDVLLWFAAAGIIGSILYMTSLERIRDFASLKAMGACTRQLVTGLGVQAVVLAVASAVTAMIVAKLLAPEFPLSVEIPHSSYPLTLVVALGVGLLGSFAGVRRAVSADPALAFGA